jgi:hypothetical protein
MSYPLLSREAVRLLEGAARPWLHRPPRIHREATNTETRDCSANSRKSFLSTVRHTAQITDRPCVLAESPATSRPARLLAGYQGLPEAAPWPRGAKSQSSAIAIISRRIPVSHVNGSSLRPG